LIDLGFAMVDRDVSPAYAVLSLSARKVLVAIEGKITRGNSTATMRCQPLSLRT
jgi:hypothetical protein